MGKRKKIFGFKTQKNHDMKTRIALILALTMALCAPAKSQNTNTKPDTTKPKEYCLSLPVSQWDTWLQRLNVVANSLKQSDIPSRTTTILIDSVLAPIQNLILSKIGDQVRADSNPLKVSSTSGTVNKQPPKPSP